MSEEIKPTPEDRDIEKNKTVAALSYAWILFLVPLLGNRNSKYAQFHAKQGMVLFITWMPAYIIMMIPGIGTLVLLGYVVISVMGIIKALNGEWWKMPYLYNWSKKFNI